MVPQRHDTCPHAVPTAFPANRAPVMALLNVIGVKEYFFDRTSICFKCHQCVPFKYLFTISSLRYIVWLFICSFANFIIVHCMHTMMHEETASCTAVQFDSNDILWLFLDNRKHRMKERNCTHFELRFNSSFAHILVDVFELYVYLLSMHLWNGH